MYPIVHSPGVEVLVVLPYGCISLCVEQQPLSAQGQQAVQLSRLADHPAVRGACKGRSKHTSALLELTRFLTRSLKCPNKKRMVHL